MYASRFHREFSHTFQSIRSNKPLFLSSKKDMVIICNSLLNVQHNEANLWCKDKKKVYFLHGKPGNHRKSSGFENGSYIGSWIVLKCIFYLWMLYLDGFCFMFALKSHENLNVGGLIKCTCEITIFRNYDVSWTHCRGATALMLWVQLRLYWLPWGCAKFFACGVCAHACAALGCLLVFICTCTHVVGA